jgi:hypothetical protein
MTVPLPSMTSFKPGTRVCDSPYRRRFMIASQSTGESR